MKSIAVHSPSWSPGTVFVIAAALERAELAESTAAARVEEAELELNQALTTLERLRAIVPVIVQSVAG